MAQDKRIKKPVVYLKEHIHPAAVEALKERAEVVSDFSRAEEIEGIITRGERFDELLMKTMPNLKVLGKHGVGYDNIDIEAAKRLGKRVVFTPGCNTESVAELAVTHMLNVCRKVPRAFAGMKADAFDDIAPAELEGMELQGKTLGMVGLGRIGRRISEILKFGFGMTVVFYDPYVPASGGEALGARKAESIGELLRGADVVNISIPLSDGTRNLIGREELAVMRPGAILVNTSRGGIVDEEALYEALSSGKIRGAGMDVFSGEPIPGSHPLLSLDNFVATPHIGACTEEAMYRVGMMVVEEVLDVIEGREPKYPVV